MVRGVRGRQQRRSFKGSRLQRADEEGGGGASAATRFRFFEVQDIRVGAGSPRNKPPRELIATLFPSFFFALCVVR